MALPRSGSAEVGQTQNAERSCDPAEKQGAKWQQMEQGAEQTVQPEGQKSSLEEGWWKAAERPKETEAAAGRRSNSEWAGAWEVSEGVNGVTGLRTSGGGGKG